MIQKGDKLLKGNKPYIVTNVSNIVAWLKIQIHVPIKFRRILMFWASIAPHTVEDRQAVEVLITRLIGLYIVKTIFIQFRQPRMV